MNPLEIVLYKRKPQNTGGLDIHGTRNKKYISINELQKRLRLNRINIRGKDTLLLNQGGHKRRFMNTKHLQKLLGRKPHGNRTAAWLGKLFLDIDMYPEPSQPPPASHVRPPPAQTIRTVTVEATNEVIELLENHSMHPDIRRFLVGHFGLESWDRARIARDELWRLEDERRARGEEEKVEEILIAGLLVAPKELVPVIQVLTSANAGMIQAEE